MRGEIHKVRPLLGDPEGTVRGSGFDRGVEERISAVRRPAVREQHGAAVDGPQYPSAVMPDEQTTAPGDRASAG